VAVPNVRASLAAGWRATAASLWLAPVGMLVAILCSGVALPARLFGAAVAVRGALAGVAHDRFTPGAAVAGAIETLLRPRLAALLAGLWAAGALLSAALRIAYLAGALPTLGHALARSSAPPPAFATGLAWGTPRLAGTAILVFLVELVGTGFTATVLLGTILVSLHADRLPGPIPAALVVAAAATLALLLSFALATLGDAALARAALSDEPPLEALAGAARRFMARPAAFLLTALFAAFAGWVVTGSARATVNVALGAARGAPGWLLLGPQLLTLAVAALLGALLELWRIASVAALACHQDLGDPPAARATAPAAPGNVPR
jgi:hypothetical protein